MKFPTWTGKVGRIAAGVLFWPLGAWWVWRSTSSRWLRGAAVCAGALWALLAVAVAVTPAPEAEVRTDASPTVSVNAPTTPLSSPSPSPTLVVTPNRTATAASTPAATVAAAAPAPTPPPPAATAAPFFGGKYSTMVRDRIEALAAAKDCPGLQAEFNTAERNDAITRTRTGSGTADLMAYIDKTMRDAGCYSR